jgi:cobalt/nickel transport system permease protein
MHLPDHFLDPATSTATALLSAGALAYAAVRIRRSDTPAVLPAAAVAAGTFAAQMLNYPVASGTSGHLVGGALAGMLLGPWMGLWAMAAVLAVQAIVFGDGGIVALGANILNMGVIGVAIGSRSRLPSGTLSPVARLLSAALAGWLAVVAGALACSLQMAASGTAAAADVVPAMLRVHALIGLSEGAITALVVMAVALAVGRLSSTAAHRQAVSRTDRADGRFGLNLRAGALLITIALVALAPFASSLPDGLERVTESLVADIPDAAAVRSLLPDYEFPGIAWPAASTILAGLTGVFIVHSLAVAAAFAWRRSIAIIR